MSRRVVFPLKFKLILIMAILIGGSIAIYTTFALDLFQKDKSAYIYDTNKSTNASFHKQVSNEISRNKERLNLIKSLERDKVEKAFSTFQNMFSLSIRDTSGRDDKFFNVNLVERSGLSIDEFKNIENSLLLEKELQIIEFDNLRFIALQLKESGSQVIGLFSLDELNNISSQFPLYNSYVLNLDGSSFWSESVSSYFGKEILDKNLDSAVFEVKDKESYILSFVKDSNLDLIFVSKIKKEFAYKVNDYLVGKTKIFALVILSLTGLIALLFSRSLTSPLEILFNFTQKFSNGNFDEVVKIRSKDEIGALGDSFNYMSKEINRYMGEMEEKARLENEVQTAKYVQSTYFPEEKVNLKSSNISSFYSPAAECGGDWWGYIELDDKLIVVITDATGHGVPAALLTATAHSCLENIKQLSKTNPELVSSPSNILEFMNKSITCLEGKLLMTAFCCVIDLKENFLIYSNASHNPPFLFKKTSAVSKDNFEPLLGANGPRLGHKERGEYEELTRPFEDGQRLILFTDGILESLNSDNKEYGSRRFMKSLVNNAMKTNFEFKKHVINDAWEFYGDIPINDDLTFVSVEFGANDKVSICVDLEKNILESKVLENYKIVSNESRFDFHITDSLSDISDKTFFLSKEDDERNIVDVLASSSVNHLVGANAKRIDLEIKNNFSQYFNLNGIDNYISSKIVEVGFKSKEDLEKVNNVIENFTYEACFQSPIDYLKIISNELLTNALYHSSDDTTEASRTTKIELSDKNKISFKLGCDENYLAVSVKDSAGKLDRDVIVANLRRSFEEKEHQNKDGGAGLGLYMAYSYSNQFIVINNRNISSEVICIIDVNKRFKKYKERITSFHYFEKKGSS